MKKISFTWPDGRITVISPSDGWRLVQAVVYAKERYEFETPVPACSIHRVWPHPEITAVEWAETEEQFAGRIAARDVLVTLDAPYVDPESGAVLHLMHRIDAERLGLAWTETPFQIIDAAAIPGDRTFREAWKVGAGGIEHDLPKCREIHRNRLRAMRRPEFEKLDAAWMKATAARNLAAAAAAEQARQELRDAPSYAAIDAATTPDELKAAVPPCLA